MCADSPCCADPAPGSAVERQCLEGGVGQHLHVVGLVANQHIPPGHPSGTWTRARRPHAPVIAGCVQSWHVASRVCWLRARFCWLRAWLGADSCRQSWRDAWRGARCRAGPQRMAGLPGCPHRPAAAARPSQRQERPGSWNRRRPVQLNTECSFPMRPTRNVQCVLDSWVFYRPQVCTVTTTPTAVESKRRA